MALPPLSHGPPTWIGAAASAASALAEAETLPPDHPLAARAGTAFAAVAWAASTIEGWAGRLEAYDLKPENGDPTDPVTAVDREIEAEIVTRVRKAHPSDLVVGEEGHRDAWDPHTAADGDVAWIIDPIDGTKNFLHGSVHCSCSLAIAVGRHVELGIVAAPLVGDIFWAVRGMGAFSSLRGRLRVSSVRALPRAALTYDVNSRDAATLALWGDRWRRLMARPVQSLRCHGSAALEICNVARGATDLHIEDGLDVWDVAAGWLILQEAGGVLFDAEGEPLASLADWAGSVIASNSFELAADVLRCFLGAHSPAGLAKPAQSRL